MKKRKLKLHRETIRHLRQTGIHQAVGGGISEFSACDRCNTNAVICIETGGCGGGGPTEYCCSNSGGAACTVGCG